MGSGVLLAGVLLLAVVGSVCLAQVVHINPHKTVLNAQGAADDVLANVPIVLPSTWEVDLVNTKLSFNGVIVARAESARYCYFDDMLIIGFDRALLQQNEDVQDMADKTVTAKVDGHVTVEYDGVQKKIHFIRSGDGDIVEIVKPDKKGH